MAVAPSPPTAPPPPAPRDRVERFGDRLARLGWQRPRAPEPLPVALHRRRIFVLPTGYGAFVAVLLLAMIVGALNYNNNPALMLGFALAATALYSLIQGQLVLAGLRAAALHAAPVHAGQVLQLRIDLEMGTRRVRRGIELLLGDARAAVSLEAGERREVALAVPAPRRGWWTPPRLRVSTVQPLGLARTWSWVRPDVRLLVYPALEASAAPLPEGEGERPNQRRSLWGDEFHHLREYRTGDPTRKIAWRPSARTGRLLVREHEDVAGRELLLDWHALGALEYEARIRRLARWVVDAERAGSRYRLRLPRETLGPGIGPDHRHACLRALALLPPA